jgi:hypothetical protein
MVSPDSRAFRWAATAVSLSFVPVGLFFSLLGFAAGWGDATEWAELTLLVGGVVLSGLAVAAAAEARRGPPGRFVAPVAAVLTICLIAAAVL